MSRANTATLRAALLEIEKLPSDQQEVAFAQFSAKLSIKQLEALFRILGKMVRELVARASKNA